MSSTYIHICSYVLDHQNISKTHICVDSLMRPFGGHEAAGSHAWPGAHTLVSLFSVANTDPCSASSPELAGHQNHCCCGVVLWGRPVGHSAQTGCMAAVCKSATCLCSACAARCCNHSNTGSPLPRVMGYRCSLSSSVKAYRKCSKNSKI